tara:strand:- start:91045 stop:91776 length:732 start_codon:yes stop_codon:yes gene_type:complete
MLKLTIYLDAETLPPLYNNEQLETFKQNLKVDGRIKKEEAIQKWIEENWEEKFRKLGTDTSKADLATLAFSINKEKVRCFINEESDGKRFNEDLINAFYEAIREKVIEMSDFDISELSDEEKDNDEFMKFVDIKWCGFNIRKFDLDLLWKHAIKAKNRKLQRLIPRGRFDNNVIDLMEVYNGPEIKYTSQQEVCDFLGIKGKPDDIDGSQVFDYWIADRKEEIAEYNIFDVEKVIEMEELLLG